MLSQPSAVVHTAGRERNVALFRAPSVGTSSPHGTGIAVRSESLEN